MEASRLLIGCTRITMSACQKRSVLQLDQVIEKILDCRLILEGTPLARGPHFLMLFAAVSHALFGIPAGDIDPDEMPGREGEALTDLLVIQANLGMLTDVIQMDEREVSKRFFAFKYASAGSTQRIRSRKPRFLTLSKALLPEPL